MRFCPKNAIVSTEKKRERQVSLDGANGSLNTTKKVAFLC